MVSDAATASGGGEPLQGWNSVRKACRSGARSSWGMPSSSQMTRKGNGYASRHEIHHLLRPRRGQLGEQLVGDELDRWFDRGDAGGRERSRHEAAQPGVVGRIEVHHVSSEGGSG